ncbi:hypothetical protein VTH06DRAFT_477 [Thermothelomyces fergusii]
MQQMLLRSSLRVIVELYLAWPDQKQGKQRHDSRRSNRSSEIPIRMSSLDRQPNTYSPDIRPKCLHCHLCARNTSGGAVILHNGHYQS